MEFGADEVRQKSHCENVEKRHCSNWSTAATAAADELTLKPVDRIETGIVLEGGNETGFRVVVVFRRPKTLQN